MKDLIIGSHAFFIPEGTVIDGVTVARDAKPDASPETNWTDFKIGSVERLQVQNTGTAVDRWAPNPGVYQIRKRLMTQRQITYTLGLQEWDELTLVRLLFGGGEPSGGVFVPGSQQNDVEGWLKIQSYDQNNDIILTIDTWTAIRVEDFTFQNSVEPYNLIGQVLSSELNVGQLQNL